MPGILPMKVIKVGSNSQSRVAQACDRCRSKKIRCDGIRPSCSQCTNVGFECKTSDKLSRRAFPRGYTESLEDRVRSLEAEVRELKSLLDEKDERIDVLTRLQSFSLSSQKATSSPVSNISTSPAGYYPRPPQASRNEGEDLIYVQQSARSISKPADDTSFTGHSSTRSFIDSFSVRLERSGKSPTTALADALLCAPSLNARRHEDITPSNILPRLVSDRLLNIFFQEWAPLYPIVHRPEILKLYSRYTTNPDSIEADHHAFAQLNLIFGIAAISSTSRVPQDPLFFERHWIPKLKMLANDISLTTLQCYVLAQVYYSIKADYRSLLHYRGLGVSICLQLGLHHSQERFSLNPLVSETRKRVFWCQYTLDRFGAAFTGLPVLLAESDISTEYPADVDDENVTETGFVPTIPEESTRMSSALALFSASRILHRVLEDLYPSPAGYEISLSTVHSLAENLDEWLKNLPAHLQLTFLLDKPNASVASSRSILLSTVYYFIRTLIRRPAVSFGSSDSSSPSMLSLVDSAKHIIQLLRLLEDRRMSLSLCMNKRELILISGLGLLWQNLQLGRDSKLVKDAQKSLTATVSLLENESIEAALEFTSLINLVSDSDRPMPDRAASGGVQEFVSKLKRSRLSFSSEPGVSTPMRDDLRKANMRPSSPRMSRSVRSSSSHSSGSYDQRDQMQHHQVHPGMHSGQSNLGYVPLQVKKDNKKQMQPGYNPQVGMTEWDHALNDIDGGHGNIFPGIYSGGECGQAPGAFNTLPSNYPPSQQSTPALGMPVLHSSPDSMQGWPQESWTTAPRTAIPRSHPHTSHNGANPANGGTPAESPSAYNDGRGMDMRDQHMAQGHSNTHEGSNGHIHTCAPPLNPFEAMVMPHNLDSMQGTTNFNVSVTSGWGQHSVM
ncbi:C6 transcription factor [Trichophyton violaceum]|uniref:C6 transcription factor n=1 Tax=Trichophyton violaceum TaxID=34388 RepID=A0A178FV62_TRIVO|nr:C6 transcription factor [Trichophyton violaceum]